MLNSKLFINHKNCKLKKSLCIKASILKDIGYKLFYTFLSLFLLIVNVGYAADKVVKIDPDYVNITVCDLYITKIKVCSTVVKNRVCQENFLGDIKATEDAAEISLDSASSMCAYLDGYRKEEKKLLICKL